MNPQDAIRQIERAIKELEKLQTIESDIGRIREIGAAIERLIFQKISVHWDNLGARTAALAEFVTDLQAVIDQGSSAPTGAAAIQRLADIATTVTDAIATATGGTRAARRGARSITARGDAAAAVTTPRSPAFAAMPPLRILAVHGVGGHAVGGDWQNGWREAIDSAIDDIASDRRFDVHFVHYDDIVRKYGVQGDDYARALWQLGWSGFTHGLGDLFRPRGRGLFDVPHAIRWSAGMVAQWASQDDFRRDTRNRLSEWMNAFDYDVVLAHSLGSVIAYDTFLHDRQLIDGRTFISFGSQIGNPFVRGTFGGRLVGLDGANWYHLFNEKDSVFTAPVRLVHPTFLQINTHFDEPWDIANHSAAEYLEHPEAIDVAWRAVVTGVHFAMIDLGLIARDGEANGGENGESSGSKVAANRPRPGSGRGGAAAMATVRETEQVFSRLRKRPQRRALLVGINNYPNVADRLEGCVNDVFVMSALLQDMRYRPDEIRVVLDERASAAGIMDRLHWLLDDAEPGQERVLYYSGHGAQIPAYGFDQEVDHIDECLVPHDFDWSPERAITDDDFFELYSQLDFGVNFVAIFDCCHSGGMERSGAARARGLNPPDDIRHRALEWDGEMWIPRRFENSVMRRVASTIEAESARDKSSDKRSIEADVRRFVGQSHNLHRLGGAAPLRRVMTGDGEGREAGATHRPYMPVIIQACRENELAYEYRDGVTSYGAFTFTLKTVLRRMDRGNPPTFQELVNTAAEEIASRGFAQRPEIRGPSAVVTSQVPWSPIAAKRAGRTAPSSKKRTTKKTTRKKSVKRAPGATAVGRKKRSKKASATSNRRRTAKKSARRKK